MPCRRRSCACLTVRRQGTVEPSPQLGTEGNDAEEKRIAQVVRHVLVVVCQSDRRRTVTDSDKSPASFWISGLCCFVIIDIYFRANVASCQITADKCACFHLSWATLRLTFATMLLRYMRVNRAAHDVTVNFKGNYR